MAQESVHSIQHTEITATDPAKLRKFLETQFGWKFETYKMPQGDYNLFRMPDGNGGGVMAPMPGQPIAATPYITVTDCDATLTSCQKAGAEIMMPVTEVPGQGKFFIFRYGGGPPLACWQQTGPRN
jgi:hypothetical protein